MKFNKKNYLKSINNTNNNNNNINNFDCVGSGRQPVDRQADRVAGLHGGGRGHRIPLDRLPPLRHLPVCRLNQVLNKKT